jgi:PAS domain-containing protein
LGSAEQRFPLLATRPRDLRAARGRGNHLGNGRDPSRGLCLHLRASAGATDSETRSWEPYEYRILLPEGIIRWVLAYGEAQFEASKGGERAVRYVRTLQHITERRTLDEHLVHLAQRLKLALEAGGMAVWEVDIKADTLVASPAGGRGARYLRP